MDINNMASNECLPVDNDMVISCEPTDILEISEAINDIDHKITELELALNIDPEQYQQ